MTYLQLIDGQMVEGASTLDVINPATGEVFAVAARADAAQLEHAVQTARQAFPAWRDTPAADRKALVNKVADGIEQRFDEFVRALTGEQGKPLDQAEYEIGAGIACLRYFAGLDTPDEVLRETPTEKIIRHRSPLGVVAAITPWNYPVLLLMMKVGPGLVAGNTMICKPAPTTPITTLLFAEVAQPILPAGVLSVIVDENDLGGALASHPDIAKVSFTGSTATGRKVMEGAASTLKRLTLELGGNDAAIVLDDADIKEIAPKVFMAATLNAGQICLAAKRVYVPTDMYDAFCDELARLAREAVVDEGTKQGAQIGPVQNRQQFEKLKEYLADAQASGKVIAGGAPLDRPGYFIAPTIVRDIPDASRLVREEQFGPVLPVLSYDTLDEALERANDSEWGLGGTIWTSNPERGIEVARRINTGTVWINKHLDLPFDIPFAGSKQSGAGMENGVEGYEEYTQAHIINAAL